ncbi:MAG: hypothetical protein ACXWKB_10580, partial [Methyloceanibacter sp.]
HLVELERFDDRLDFFHAFHRTSLLGIEKHLSRALPPVIRQTARSRSTPYANCRRGSFSYFSNDLYAAAQTS